MYDEHQHLDLFHSPGRHLFRETLPSRAFAGPYRGAGVTPTSVDPVVATLFACRWRMEGSAIVLLARKSDFEGLLDGPNLASCSYELAVNIEVPQAEFERRCFHWVSVDDSLSVLRQLGYVLPSRLPDLGALTGALTQSPRMLLQEIDSYVEQCQRRENR